MPEAFSSILLTKFLLWLGVVGMSDTEDGLLVGECKWSNSPVGVNILDDLKRKAQGLNADGRWQQAWYALWAKSGFTRALEDVAANERVLLVRAEGLMSN